MLNNVFGLLPEEIELSGDSKLPVYRKQQLLTWLYKQYCADPDKMLNLPSELRDSLSQRYSFVLPEIQTRLKASDNAVKFGLKLEDGSIIESVLIPEARKRTLCISSQVGCARACSFCSTGKMKLRRNLEIHEIIGQIIVASADLKNTEAEATRLLNLVASASVF
ncbi:MAG TPA: 23S rRNA (adenine(2503)-C(2))-methyltransferase RlmN, partial [Candidatus Cloacimonas sp.]|nr:23S rRNA (adenine(2503)-C(2))-methyltransferase RlmN [Candidatus Cloacimonas sp.]